MYRGELMARVLKALRGGGAYTVHQLAEATGLPYRAALTAVVRLKNRGLVEAAGRARKRNVYGSVTLWRRSSLPVPTWLRKLM